MTKLTLNRGFTLFELVLVISISGFILSMIGYFYIAFVKNKLYEAKQLSIFNEQVLTQEYLSRQIKNALPQTIKISSDQQCVEFIKILGAGLFLSEQLTKGNFLREIALDKNAKNNYKQTRYLYLLESNGSAGGDLHPVFSVSENSISLAINNEGMVYPAFLLLSDVNQFCLYDNQMRFYKSANRPDFIPVAGPVSSVQPFRLNYLNEQLFQLQVSLIFGDEVSLSSEFVITINNEY